MVALMCFVRLLEFFPVTTALVCHGYASLLTCFSGMWVGFSNRKQMIFHLFQRVGEHAVFERPMILLNVPFASSATQLINDPC